MATDLNGQMVHYSKDLSTVFMPLPAELRRPIAGGCRCEACKRALAEDPTFVPCWDTLAIRTKPEAGRHTSTSWLVHRP